MKTLLLLVTMFIVWSNSLLIVAPLEGRLVSFSPLEFFVLEMGTERDIDSLINNYK